MKRNDQGAMRQIDDPLPNLGQSRRPWTGGIGSKGWVPRNTFARVGVFMFGATFVTCALSMIAASLLLKGEMQASIPLPVVGFLASFLAVMMVLCVAGWFLWYGGRLVMSSFRRAAIRKK
jgi:VIT1/CCC1 family predicted Fe2+/Mn2+ transporter